MPTNTYSDEILAAALEGYQSQKERIEAKIAELQQMLKGGSGATEAAPAPQSGRRTLSAAARARIAEAQRKRWANARKDTGQQSKAGGSTEKAKPKRRLSAEGRKRIIEATKKRWERVRAAKAQQSGAAKRKAGRKSAGKKTRGGAKKAAPKPAAAAAETQAQS
jgi:hypothetical protein